jgi:hypothetical protein
MYQKARGSSKITLAKKFYDIEKRFPKRISKVLLTQTD